MATLDAGRLTTRQLNTRLKEEAEKGAEITILNPQAAHNIGAADDGDAWCGWLRVRL